jgi:hypothetical protein
MVAMMIISVGTIYGGSAAEHVFIISSLRRGDGVWFFSATYVVFKNCVVQFFNDNLNDCHGIISTLYQDIAAEIFEDADLHNVYYNTDVERGQLGMPLGEWP